MDLPEKRRPVQPASPSEQPVSQPQSSSSSSLSPSAQSDETELAGAVVPKTAAERALARDKANWMKPWVQLKYFSFHPCIYPAMVRAASPGTRPGQIVNVYDPDGYPFGQGFYNHRAKVPLRMFHHGEDHPGEAQLEALLEQAIALRVDILELPKVTDAFRVVHSDGDCLSGLVVDRFGDVLSLEVHSLGVYARLSRWLPMLHERLGTKRAVVQVDPWIARMEGISIDPSLSQPVRNVRIREHGVTYEVDFASGHKTGFFCDQRDNRLRASQLAKGQRVLDLCCYTGGFAVAAKVRGGAAEVTGVDLDEDSIAQAKRNANLNQARIEWVHVDAFSYGRQMMKNTGRWGLVIADPPKFVTSRDEMPLARRKYEDINALAAGLTTVGGWLVTFSCSGLLTAEDFEALVIRGVHRQGRRLQIIDRTGPGGDHPVMSNCPESRYLKALWCRVW